MSEKSNNSALFLKVTRPIRVGKYLFNVARMWSKKCDELHFVLTNNIVLVLNQDVHSSAKQDDPRNNITQNLNIFLILNWQKE